MVAVLTLLWQLGYLHTRKAAPPQPQIELSKTSGPVGTVVRVNGSGFRGGEAVKLYAHVYEVGTAEADDSGNFSQMIRIIDPTGVAKLLGQIQVSARGLASKRVAQTAFNVTGATTTTPPPPTSTGTTTPTTPTITHTTSTTTTTTTTKPKVPYVVGLTFTAASAQLQNAGFDVARRDVDSNAPKDQVVAQEPTGSAAPNSTITLSVSKGPSTSTVPDVTGQDKTSAKSTLQSAGFKVAVNTQNVNDPGLDGIVLSQTPTGGSKVPKGSKVTIVVGSFTVPGTP